LYHSEFRLKDESSVASQPSFVLKYEIKAFDQIFQQTSIIIQSIKLPLPKQEVGKQHNNGSGSTSDFGFVSFLW
jgi:hypothetical protein